MMLLPLWKLISPSPAPSSPNDHVFSSNLVCYVGNSCRVADDMNIDHSSASGPVIYYFITYVINLLTY